MTNPDVGDPPSGREGHVAAVFRNFLIVFGGLSADGLLNDTHALDLDMLEWRQPPVAGACPFAVGVSACSCGLLAAGVPPKPPQE